MNSEIAHQRGSRNLAMALILIVYSILAYQSFRLSLLSSGTEGETGFRFLRDITTIGYALGPIFALVGTAIYILIATRVVVLLGDILASEYEIGAAYAISFVVRIVFVISVLLFDNLRPGDAAGYFDWRFSLRNDDPTAHLLVFEVFETAIIGFIQSFVTIKVLSKRTQVIPSLRTYLTIWLPFALFQASQLLLALSAK